MPDVSIVIATRGRPRDIARCLDSISQLDHPDFEVVLVDQSDDADTEAIVNQQHVTVRYLKQPMRGRSNALNLGIRESIGQVVAITDDDCTVPSDWLTNGLAELRQLGEAAIVCGALLAGAHDPEEAFIPTFRPKREGLAPVSWRMRPSEVGIGANMFLTKQAVHSVGLFNAELGAGATFRAAEDLEYLWRSMVAGVPVLSSAQVAVIHWGARSYSDGSARRLVEGSYYGMGAMCIAACRRAPREGLQLLTSESTALIMEVIWSLARGRRPLGARHITNFALGLWSAVWAGRTRLRVLESPPPPRTPPAPPHP